MAAQPTRSMARRRARGIGLVLAAGIVAACSAGGPTPLRGDSGPGRAAPQGAMPGSGGRSPTVVAAGDISPAALGEQARTARLVRKLAPTRVLALGDLQYPAGSLAGFRAFYDPTWGTFKARTKPAPGNHEYETPGARGYFEYFGKAARSAGRSYYSFDLGGWHLISLNSNIAGGTGSAQAEWLRADLRRTSQRCVLAYWHHPRFSSGANHGGDTGVATFWRALYRQRADLVLSGHEHNYERFARQNPRGAADSRGIRQFIAGTGGAHQYPFAGAHRNSQVRITGRYGVLRLTLHPRSYAWRFVAVGGNVLDRGGPVACH